MIDKFRTGECAYCAHKVLNQGTDIPDVGVGIIVGLDSKSLPLIQRMGRIIRRGDKVGKIFILYVIDSQEEKWLKDATKTITNVQKGEDLEYYLKWKDKELTQSTDATDKLIYDGMERRGTNSNCCSQQAEQEIFRKTGFKMTTSSIQNRYYQLRKERQQNTQTDMDVRGYLIELLTKRPHHFGDSRAQGNSSV